MTPVTITATDTNLFPLSSKGGFQCIFLIPPDQTIPSTTFQQQQSCTGALSTGVDDSIFFSGIGNAVVQPGSEGGIKIAITGGTGKFLGAHGSAIGTEVGIPGDFTTSVFKIKGKVCLKGQNQQ